MLNNIYNKIEEIFTNLGKIDYRSLAIFRIGIGLLILIDLIFRLPDLWAFYTDQGILPRFALLQFFSDANRFSVYNISGQFWFVLLLFIISAISALFLIFGYKTKLASFISWFLLLSLHNRNELVLQAGDNLFHIIMFWSLFLPLGKVWSLDSLLGKTKFENIQEPNVQNSVKQSGQNCGYISNIASLAVLIQVAITLLFAALLKTGNEWIWPNFTASGIALRVNYLGTPFGRWLLNFPELLKVSTALLAYIELYSPLLLFFPFKNDKFRIIVLPIILVMLFSFGLGLEIFLFPYIFIVCFTLFIPSIFWTWLANKFKPTEELTFYYDQTCSFCTTAACVLQKSLVVVSGQSKQDTLEAMLKYDSFIVEDDQKKRYYKFDAILRVGQSWPTFSWLVPVFKKGFLYNLGNNAYEIIAKNRHKISDFIDVLRPRTDLENDDCYNEITEAELNKNDSGKATETIKVSKLNKANKFSFKIPNFVVQALAAFFLVYILFWNIGDIYQEYKVPKPLDQIGWTLGLNQRWDMFAPSPLNTSGWYVMPGVLADGTKVDVFNKSIGQPYLYQADLTNVNKTNGSNYNFEEKVRQLPTDMTSQGWRKYLTDYVPSNSKAKEYFGGYLCRRWNENSINNFSNIFTGNSGLAETNSNRFSNMFETVSNNKRLLTFKVEFFERTVTENEYSLPRKITIMEYSCY